MIDPEFPLQGGLGDFFGKLGLASDPAIVIDPLNHSGSDNDKVAVPYYPPHPISRRIAFDHFSERATDPCRRSSPGVNTTILASSSKDSYLRLVSQAPAATEPTGSDAAHGPAVLAVAVEGRWPDGHQARRNHSGWSWSATATSPPIPISQYISDGNIAVRSWPSSRGRETRPAAKPQSYNPRNRSR